MASDNTDNSDVLYPESYCIAIQLRNVVERLMTRRILAINCLLMEKNPTWWQLIAKNMQSVLEQLSIFQLGQGRNYCT